MTTRGLSKALSLLIGLGVTAVSPAARGFELGVGLEGGGGASIAGNPALRLDGTRPAVAGSATVGLLLEQRFTLRPILFEIWEDAETPFTLQTGQTTPAGYVPLDVGVRTGLVFGAFEPYLGPVFQVAFLTTVPAQPPALSSSLFGIGGDLGLDVRWNFFRFGVELRAVEVVGGIVAVQNPSGRDNPSAALELQGLASARLSL